MATGRQPVFPSASPPLGPREVDVFAVRLAGIDPGTAWNVLDRGERSRAERFRFDRDRLAFVSATASVRFLLASYLSIEPEAVALERSCRTCGSTDHGKPAVACRPGSNAPPLQFSTARRNEVAACAVTAAGQDIGVDLEREAGIDWEAIASEFLGRAEQASMKLIAPTLRARHLVQAWVVKEACLKAVGLGIAAGLTSYARSSLSTTTGHWARVDPTVAGMPTMHALNGDGPLGFAMAVAAAKPLHVRSWADVG